VTEIPFQLFPSFWKRKSRWWLNSSVSVAFSDGHSAPLLVSPSLCFLSYPTHSLCLSLLYTPFSLFFFSLCLVAFSSTFCSLFPPLAMVPPLAFIAQGKHCGGNGRQDSSHKTCPIIGAICCKTYPCFNAENDFLWRRQWIVETAPFQNFKMNIFDSVLGCFDNFVIKPPVWIVIGSLDFKIFSSLVFGFGLFQLSL